MHEGASSGVKSSGATSLQRDVLAEVTYSNGDIIIALQEVLAWNLQFHNGTYSEYQLLLNSFLITFNLLLPKTTVMFFNKLSELSKSTLLTLLLKMKSMHATILTFASEDDIVSENEAFNSHLVNYS